jgi:hypothetical protein
MRPRFTIATLAFVVVLLALDFAWMRVLLPNRGFSVFGFAAQGFDLGVLPMVNLLALSLYLRLSRRERPHPFLVGFELCGLGAVLAYMAWSWADPETVGILIVRVCLAWWRWTPLSPRDPYLVVVAAISITVPQLLVAMLGGLIIRYFARSRVTVSSEP